MMGSGPWRMLADDGHVAYCFLMGASTNQKTVCYAAYHPQMLLIIRLTKQSAFHSIIPSDPAPPVRKPVRNHDKPVRNHHEPG